MTIIRYVNTNSTAGGDGTTNATVGANRAYESLSAWNTAEAQALSEPATVICSGGLDSSTLLMSGWTTSAANFILITTTDDRHDGVFDSGKYYRDVGDSVTTPFDMRENYCRIVGLQFQRDVKVPSAGTFSCIKVRTVSSGDIRFEENIFKSIAPETAGLSTAVEITDASNTYSFKNNICFDFIGTGDAPVFPTVNVSLDVYNNTFVNCTVGVKSLSNTLCVNNVFQDCTTDISGTANAGNNYNLTDNVSIPGANSVANSTLTFEDKAGDNFALAASDTDAIGSGVGPSSDANVPPTGILGVARSGATTDMGASVFVAAPATRYVNTNSTTGGDGTTNDIVGANRAYVSLLEWEAAEQAVLTEPITVVCSGGLDSSVISLSGWTTSAANFILITTTDDRHAGVFDENKYYLDVGDTALDSLLVNEEFVRIIGLQFKRQVKTPSAGTYGTISVSGVGAGDIRIEDNIFLSTAPESTTSARAIEFDDSSPNYTVKNNIFYDFGGTNDLTISGIGSGASIDIYNNTFINCLTAISSHSGYVIVNNIFQDCGTDITGSVNAGNNYNLTDNVSIPGANSVANSTLTFKDKVADNFALAASDTDAVGSGIGPSADAKVPLTGILGVARSGATTDIGASVFVAAGFPDGYTLLRIIATNPSAVTGTNNSFQGLITEAAFKLSKTDIFANTENGGGDVRFSTDKAGLNQIPIDLVSWDTAGETCQVWWLADGVDNVSPTGLYIWGNKPGDSQPTPSSTFGSESVWTNEVYRNHVDDTGLLNSVNGISGTYESGTPTQVVAQIEDGRGFVSEGIETGASFLPLAASYTLSAWVRWDGGTSGNEGTIVDAWQTGNLGYLFRYEPANGGSIEFFSFDGGADGGNFSATSLADGELHLVHARLLNDKLEVFKDGVKSVTTFNAFALTSASPANAKIGISVAFSSDFWIGVIDEVSIGAAKTDDYIATEFSNQNDVAAFYLEPLSPTAIFGCTITVAAGKMPSSQGNFTWVATESNFPLASKDGGLSSILNGGGNLRCYTDATKAVRLPIEVVTFVTGGSPDIQVWGLSSSLAVGSTVYVEADTSATSQPAAAEPFGRNAVWAQNIGTYHLEEAGGVDSSGNNDLTTLGGTPASQAGQVGNGMFSDGNDHIRDTSFSASFVGSDVLVSVWINPTDTTSGDYIVYGENGGTLNVNAIIKGFQSGFANIFDNGYITGTAADTQIAITAGVWQQIVYTSDGVTVKGYKNGVEIISVSGSLSTAYGLFQLGASLTANPYAGMIDEAVLANRNPSADNILSLYNNKNDTASFWSTGAWEEQGGTTIVTGSGALVSEPSTLSGVGTADTIVTGSGALVSQPSTLSGVGKRTAKGSGALVSQPSILAGVGKRTVKGSGDLQAAPSELQGAAKRVITGDGDLVADNATLQGTGKRTIIGSGDLQTTNSVMVGTNAIDVVTPSIRRASAPARVNAVQVAASPSRRGSLTARNRTQQVASSNRRAQPEE